MALQKRQITFFPPGDKDSTYIAQAGIKLEILLSQSPNAGLTDVDTTLGLYEIFIFQNNPVRIVLVTPIVWNQPHLPA